MFRFMTFNDVDIPLDMPFKILCSTRLSARWVLSEGLIFLFRAFANHLWCVWMACFSEKKHFFCCEEPISCKEVYWVLA